MRVDVSRADTKSLNVCVKCWHHPVAKCGHWFACSPGFGSDEAEDHGQDSLEVSVVAALQRTSYVDLPEVEDVMGLEVL